MTELREQLQTALGDAYTIERELGGGGMSRVFLAEEKALGRKVVVKILPPEMVGQVSSDRFRREISVAATLQHAHIVPLLTAGDAGGLPYFTMPYVRGESLRERIAKHGELPVSEAMRILREVASALAFAHDAGVVHRDIKPENILLAGGAAMVTDFGVAKALSASAETGATGLTTFGVALGTPAYMSPEQASADPTVDNRADIYSWGVLAYELLTGTTPFANRTPQAMLAAHVTEQPEEVSRRRTQIPPALAMLVMRTLAKRAADRPQTAGELLMALDAITTPSGGMAPTTARMAAARSMRPWMFAAAGVVVVAIVAGVMLLRGAPAPVQMGTVVPIAVSAAIEIEPSLSPDGKLVAYSAGPPGERRIYVQQVAGGRAVALTTDLPGDHGWPRWAPDGSRIAFDVSGAVYIVPALGGTPKQFAEGSPGLLSTPVWSPNGKQIAYAEVRGISVKDVEGGTAKLLVDAVPVSTPEWSPDGRSIVYTRGYRATLSNVGATSLWIIPTAGGTARQLATEVSMNVSPAWSPDGRSFFFVSNRDGTPDVYRQALTSGGKASGEPVRITTGLYTRNISLSADGTRLAYDVVRNRSNIWAAAIPASGAASITSATQVTADAQRIESMNLSHTGKWLAYDSDRSGNFDIYKVGVEGGQPVQLTTNPGNDFVPAWSPDDKEIAFHAGRTGKREIYVIGSDGSGEKQVTKTPNDVVYPDWMDGGRGLVFYERAAGRFSLRATTRNDAGSWSDPKRLTPENVQASLPRVSPDGKFISFASGSVGGVGLATEIAVMPAEGGAARTLFTVKTGSGESVRTIKWGPDANTVYFSTIDASGRHAIWSLAVAGGTPRLILRDDVNHRFGNWNFATDGRRLFFTLAADESDVFVVELKK